jgi:glycosyltransferase involved in cell wall biosynthesis
VSAVQELSSGETAPGPEPAKLRAVAGRREVACVASSRISNPYLRLLYDRLEERGFPLAPDATLTLSWLVRNRRRVRFLHFHWPQRHYRLLRGPASLRLAASWLRFGLFAVRLGAARLLGYRNVWTIHQVYPHEATSRRLDRLAALLLARSAHVLTAHDEPTVAEAERELRPDQKIEIVAHPSYRGFYPLGRPRSAVRAELGIADDAFVFLCFGEIRAYKRVDLLLEAFESTTAPEAVLLVAGPAIRDPSLEAVVESAAARDPRIRPLLGFVPDEQVAELFEASDAAVFPRVDGGTSGSLILALSLGTPIVAAETPGSVGLTGGKGAWLFRPGDADSLRATLEASATGSDAPAKREEVQRLPLPTWDDAAECLSRLLEQHV